MRPDLGGCAILERDALREVGHQVDARPRMPIDAEVTLRLARPAAQIDAHYATVDRDAPPENCRSAFHVSRPPMGMPMPSLARKPTFV